jgi:hypothetical protein
LGYEKERSHLPTEQLEEVEVPANLVKERMNKRKERENK